MLESNLISWKVHPSFFAIVVLWFFALKAISHDYLPALEHSSVDLLYRLSIVKLIFQRHESISFAFSGDIVKDDIYILHALEILAEMLLEIFSSHRIIEISYINLD